MELNQTSGSQPGATSTQLNSIEEAIEAIRKGEVIIVVDDEDRENEGDFICAAASVTPEIINFMATHGRGLICTPIDEKRADALDLPLMVSSNTALHETAFTVSIDLIGRGCTTGISAYDRATGIRALIDPETTSTDYARPGHIFPLRAKTGGVLRRTGHTEASIDLARLAGFPPVGVLVEILNEDGSMARLPQLLEISSKFGLKIVAIKDLVAYRMRNERLIKLETAFELETSFGSAEIFAFRQITTDDVHIAIKFGSWEKDDPVLVRMHSETEITEILSILIDGCGIPGHQALSFIAGEGSGVAVFMRHAEKELNVLNQIQTIKDKLSRGEKPDLHKQLEMDPRDYGVGAQILNDLGVQKIRLITSSPKKRIGLIGYGLEIVENIEL